MVHRSHLQHSAGLIVRWVLGIVDGGCMEYCISVVHGGGSAVEGKMIERQK